MTKIRFTTPIEVDEAKWAEEYGLDPKDRLAIRQDVVEYVLGLIRDSAAAQAGLLR